MITRQIVTRLGAVALLLSAAAFGAGSAEAKFIPGLGEVSDCVPGATICGKTGPKKGTTAFLVHRRICQIKAKNANRFYEDPRIVFGVCMAKG